MVASLLAGALASECLLSSASNEVLSFGFLGLTVDSHLLDHSQ